MKKKKQKKLSPRLENDFSKKFLCLTFTSMFLLTNILHFVSDCWGQERATPCRFQFQLKSSFGANKNLQLRERAWQSWTKHSRTEERVEVFLLNFSIKQTQCDLICLQTLNTENIFQRQFLFKCYCVRKQKIKADARE